MTTNTSLTRRGALGAIAAATAAGSIAGIAPAIAAALPADPIFAAIAAHGDRWNAVNRAHERFVAGLADHHPVQAALLAQCVAAKTLIETAPTTRAGLRALECYLREDRNSNVRMTIRMTGTMDDGRTYTWSCVGPEGVNWLIAQRAAEIGEA
jgi:hypothetical protein